MVGISSFALLSSWITGRRLPKFVQIWAYARTSQFQKIKKSKLTNIKQDTRVHMLSRVMFFSGREIFASYSCMVIQFYAERSAETQVSTSNNALGIFHYTWTMKHFKNTTNTSNKTVATLCQQPRLIKVFRLNNLDVSVFCGHKKIFWLVCRAVSSIQMN